MVEAVAEAVAEAVEGLQPAVRQEEEEETQNSSEQNHPPSLEIAKMLIDFYRTSRDTCHSTGTMPTSLHSSSEYT